MELDLRMRGKGQPAPFGKGMSGDLFIELIVEEHPWFERNGMDLIMSLPLGYSDLALGTTVTFYLISMERFANQSASRNKFR